MEGMDDIILVANDSRKYLNYLNNDFNDGVGDHHHHHDEEEGGDEEEKRGGCIHPPNPTPQLFSLSSLPSSSLSPLFSCRIIITFTISKLN